MTFEMFFWTLILISSEYMLYFVVMIANQACLKSSDKFHPTYGKFNVFHEII